MAILSLQIHRYDSQAEDMRKDGTPLWLVLVIQHSGIIVGFIIMYLMAAYGGQIDFSK